MKTSVKHGTVGLTLDEPFSKMLTKIIDRVAPNVETIIRENINEIYTNAKQEWIVKTGKSKDSLQKETKLILSRGKLVIAGIIRNTAPYANAIKAAKFRDSKNASGGITLVPKGAHVWSKLVREPLEARADQITKQITDELMIIKD